MSRLPTDSRRGMRRLALVIVAALTLMGIAASPAFAGSRWRLNARSAPTQLPTTGEGFISAQAINSGDVDVSAKSTPVTITDTLPAGVTSTQVIPLRESPITGEEGVTYGKPGSTAWTCSEPGSQVVTCTYDASKVKEELRKPITPYEDLELRINVETNGASGTLQNKVAVTGGREEPEPGVEAPTPVPGAEITRSLGVTGSETLFGVEENGFSMAPEDESGLLETQAGAHPFQLTTTIALNEITETKLIEGKPQTTPAAVATPKHLRFNLPPGLLGNVASLGQCSDIQFATLDSNGGANACPDDSVIGVVRVTLTLPEAGKNLFETFTAPVFNMTPKQGEPARFGFFVYHNPVTLDTRVRTGDAGGSPGGGDYGVEVYASYVTQLAQFLVSEVTLWGVPGDERHDNSRGWHCVLGGYWKQGSGEEGCVPPATHSSSAFLLMPTSCAGNPAATAAGESWPIKQNEENGLGTPLSFQTEYHFPFSFTGCGSLPFNPSVKLKPTSGEASAPMGAEVDVHVPQQTTLDASGLTESAVKTTTVTFPAGVQLSPSAANGLEACSEEQIGYQGKGSESDPFSPGSVEPLRFTASPAKCPAASKIGTVSVKTPLLKQELHGGLFIAAQDNNPFHSTLAVYIVAEDGESGLRVKLAGETKADAETGQLTSTFVNTPQVPFEDFKVDLNGGPRAALSSPPLCGSYTTAASFTPWSGGADQSSTTDPSEFTIGSGPGGSGCSNPQSFAPGFTAGVTNLQAGAFSPFEVTISRPDADQALKSISVTLPAGAAALLSSVNPCPEPQASLGTCGPDSLIGRATAVSGFGPNPFTVNGGRVYITGPYNGAPFGLSIVTPAVAGPFNLGDVVVRATINVNPETAVVTIGNVLPTIVQGIGRPSSGIPLQLKTINVVVDRPGFEFNPTNCNPLRVSGTLGGVRGATAAVSSPFQVNNCGGLKFAPKLTASVGGKASKANGASFVVKVTSAGLGQANIAKVALQLPKELPSRLTTIQKACVDSVFNANPASCPEGSNIGRAAIRTPVLKNPLTGPAYLVSHGNAGFPDVEFVLQGEGILLILDGKTDIKKGITYSRFEAAPDAPFTTFETVLPAGPHSALTANVPEKEKFSLCATKPQMPTEITAHNGAQIKQTTNIAVTGCAAKKKITKAQQLNNALKKCRKQFRHNKAKRATCEKKARKKFGPAKKKKKKKK